MRKFLTTLFAASAIALPATAATLNDGGDWPQDRTNVRHGRDADDGDRPAALSRPNDGQRAEQARPERVQVERQRPDRPRFDGMRGEQDRFDRAQVERPVQPNVIPAAPEQRSWQRGDRGGAAPSPALETPREARDGSRPDGMRRGDNAYRQREGAFNDRVARSEQYAQHRTWNRTWRDNQRYDWRNYRERNRTAFRVGVYYDPYGYNYRRFMVGWTMRPSYYGASFWIDDPWRYRLPEVYGPYRWVRYYNDAVLVDTWSGQVVDVIYNFFW